MGKQGQKLNYIEDAIPEELKWEILHYLEVNDLVKVSRVSKKWKALTERNEFWNTTGCTFFNNKLPSNKKISANELSRNNQLKSNAHIDTKKRIQNSLIYYGLMPEAYYQNHFEALKNRPLLQRFVNQSFLSKLLNRMPRVTCWTDNVCVAQFYIFGAWFLLTGVVASIIFGAIKASLHPKNPEYKEWSVGLVSSLGVLGAGFMLVVLGFLSSCQVQMPRRMTSEESGTLLFNRLRANRQKPTQAMALPENTNEVILIEPCEANQNDSTNNTLPALNNV